MVQLKDAVASEVREPRRLMLMGLACGGAAIGIGGCEVIRRSFPYFAFDNAVRAARSRAKPYVEKADAESLEGVDSSLVAISTFFEEAKSHAKAFSDDVLGWWSKYKLIRGQHEKFLAEAFRKHFFGPEELKAVMTNVVEGYVADLEAIDNRMLVDIRLDVADLPVASTLSSLSVPDLQSRYRKISGDIGGIAGADATVDAGRVVADMIVSSVVGMIAARMSTSAAVIGTGAASGWWTAGIGLVVGVIVDQIIAAVWDWAYDPRGKLIAMMEKKIDEVQVLVVEGEAGKPGLREELRRYAASRAIVRREAVNELLATAKGGG